jgi:hypothetical protein
VDARPPLFKLARRRQHRRRWTVSGVVATLVAAFVVLVVVSTVALAGFGNDLGKGLTALSNESAAASAASAAGVAKAQHVPDGSLTIALLQQYRPRMTWLPGDEASPSSTSQTSISVEGDHIITAMSTPVTACVFGVTVSSSADPIISADHLPGAGTYSMIRKAPPGQNSQPASCAADLAPTTGWERPNSAGLRALVNAESS